MGVEEALAFRPIWDLIGDAGVEILDGVRSFGRAVNHDVRHGSDIMREVGTGLVNESGVERGRRGLGMAELGITVAEKRLAIPRGGDVVGQLAVKRGEAGGSDGVSLEEVTAHRSEIGNHPRFDFRESQWIQLRDGGRRRFGW